MFHKISWGRIEKKHLTKFFGFKGFTIALKHKTQVFFFLDYILTDLSGFWDDCSDFLKALTAENLSRQTLAIEIIIFLKTILYPNEDIDTLSFKVLVQPF